MVLCQDLLTRWASRRSFMGRWRRMFSRSSVAARRRSLAGPEGGS
jgi:hypothetical protein